MQVIDGANKQIVFRNVKILDEVLIHKAINGT